MPDDYYVSQYSGEEIDERLTAAHNAVRYDAAQTLTDAQKTQARSNIGAAPSGFGWGEELPNVVSTAAEVDAITANSIVRYANGSTNLVDVDVSSYTRYAIVVTYSVNATDKAQDVYGYGGGAHGDVMLHRGRSGNTWLPWEWVNPPMLLGVEYRTTERYFGNPVYVKLVDFGALPNAGLKQVAHGLTNIEFAAVDLSRSIAGSSYNNLFPLNTNISGIDISDGYINIRTLNDLSGYNAMICLKYSKIAD